MGSSEASDIPTAPVTDLDLTAPDDREEWERRVMQLAGRRLEQARERLATMGIVDEDGQLTSEEVPSDMLPESDTSVETG